MSNCNRKIVVFDIDGTLADANHRIHHVKPEPGQKKNWPAFFEAAKDDPPATHVVAVLQLYVKAGYLVMLCTGRPAKFRNDTLRWLAKQGIPELPLIMRLTNDNSKDFISKPIALKEYLTSIGSSFEEIEAIYEDKLTVSKAWVELGIPVFLCGKEWLV